MAVSYAQTLSADMLFKEIECLFEWRSGILRQNLFPKGEAPLSKSAPPGALLAWCKEHSLPDVGGVEKFSALHAGLLASAENLHTQAAAGKPVTVEDFDAFENQCEAYILHLRRLHQDVADTASIDAVTGLRSAAGMRNDVRREQDRFDRKGAVYSAASIEIDNLPHLQSKLDRKGMDSVYTHVGRVISRAVRSFDDVYYLGKGEYFLVLKHVEFMDACAVVDRLRREVETATLPISGKDPLQVTASFGIAEAMLRESADMVIEHAKAALRDAKVGGGNRVAEFREVSALMQYAQDVNKS